MLQERQTHTLDVLARLHAAERRSLLPRLAELNAFVEWAFAPEMDQVRRMVAEESRHESWLMDAAAACGGALFPASADVGTANLHYLDIRMLLPRVIAAVDALVQLYGQALNDSANLDPASVEVLSRIRNRHQAHLEQLRAMQQRLAQS
jgi:hypothetical protein